MKMLLLGVLLVASTVVLAGGDKNRQAAPDSWYGETNKDDTERTLVVKCPAGTTADSVEASPDDQGVVIVVECNYTK